MTVYVIAPEHASDKTIRCAHCWDHAATHIELSSTGKHYPDEHLVLCGDCAYLAGLKPCSGCTHGPKVEVNTGMFFGKLIPIYAPNNLGDGKGACCAWHLGHP
ncbi:hypothetical protein ACVWZ9_001941 [Pseudomonas chlororaphis]